MKNAFGIATAVALVFGAVHAQGQSATINFQDGTDDGFGLKFSNDASANFTVANIGGSLRLQVPRTGAFQEADIGTGSNPLLAALNAAAANPTAYTLSYDWYVDTSVGNQGTFLQVGSYFNSGSGSYVQDFGTPKEVELNSTQLASGQVFSGTFSETFAQMYGNPLAAGFQGQTFMRLGFILNGDGTSQSVYFDNITIAPIIPEPTTMALLGLAVPAFWMLRRRSVKS